MLLDLWRLFSGRQRVALLALQAVSLIMGVSTLGGIAAVIPFFSVLADPQAIGHSATLSWLYSRLGFADTRAFEIALGIGFVAMLVLGNAINLLGMLAINRFSYWVGNDFHVLLFNEYLHRGLLFHLRTNSATLFNNIISETYRLAQGVIRSTLTLAANIVASTLIILSVVLLSPRVAIATALVLGGSYALIYYVARRRIARNGVTDTVLHEERAKVLNEGFGGIKEVLVLRNQEFFRRRFEQSCRLISRTAANTIAIAQSPRYVIECVTGAGLAGAALLLSARAGGPGPWLAQLTFLGLAAYRLLPALQQAFAAVVRIRVDRAAFERIATDLKIGRARQRAPAPSVAASPFQRGLRSEIRLEDVSFRYAPDLPLAIRHASLRIGAGSIVGLVGANGSGKTTLADLIVGLLVPESGCVEADGVLLTETNRPAWQATIAYVAQTVFLLDATLADNIAIGIPPREVDRGRLDNAIAKARLDELVAAAPDGYNALIGERGARLSGGQRQRIGIARALYRSASILVLDEATNALDDLTEHEVMATLEALRGERTVILIAHRLSTVSRCDVIFELENGAIVGAGSFDELVRSSSRFRALAGRAGEPKARRP